MNDSDLRIFMDALQFAADKHRAQKRKGADATPYINHLIDVTATLVKCGVSDTDMLVAALLHDAIEDLEIPAAKIAEQFGQPVARLVVEVSDDKTLDKAERKQKQIEKAPSLSNAAKQLKIADKISNVRDVAHAPAADWSHQRRMDYLKWSEDVVEHCRGVNDELDRTFDRALAEGRTVLDRRRRLLDL